jgi:predicted amidophosphoribosyltransferase
MRLPYGIKIDEAGNIALNEYEAEVVCLIFDSYLSGQSLSSLRKMLAEKNIQSPTGNASWSNATLDKLLFNRKYLPIVGMEKYFAVQFEKDHRSTIDMETRKRKAAKYDSRNVLSGLFICGECGKSYRRVQRASGEMVWRCANRVEHGSKICKFSPSITEKDAIRFVCETMGVTQLDHESIRETIVSITVKSNGTMTPDFQQSEIDEMGRG